MREHQAGSPGVRRPSLLASTMFLITFFLIPSRVFAWDFYAHYARRVDAITSDVATLSADSTDTVVLLGDSLTEANDVKQLCGRRVVNMGISADQIAMTTTGVTIRVPLVAKARPADIFLLIGINDFGNGKPLSKAKAEYGALVAELRKAVPGARLHIQSLLPTSGPFARHVPKVQEMNAWLKEFAASNQLDYLDLHKWMSDEKGQFQPKYTTDGLHVTALAYEAWNKELERALGCGK